MMVTGRFVSGVLLLVLLSCTLCAGFSKPQGVSGQTRGGLLVAYKTLLNAEAVLGQPLTANIRIFNVGDAPAYDVQLRDANWVNKNQGSLSLLKGSLVTSWPVLLPGANISHTYAVTPVVGGAANLDSTIGDVLYSQTPGGEQQLTRTTELGSYLQVQYAPEVERKAQPFLVEWFIFAGLSLTTLVIPYLRWSKSRSSFHSLKKRS